MATSNTIVVIRATDMSAANANHKYFGRADPLPGRFGARQGILGICRLLSAMAAGVVRGTVFATVLDDAGTKAASTIACTRANAAGNYVRWTYGGKTVTLTEGVDFVRGASDTTCGDNLATAINANATLKQLFSAAAVTGTVTLTPKFPTQLYEDIAMSTDDATAFALTQATGGTEGAAQFFLRAFDCGGNP